MAHLVPGGRLRMWSLQLCFHQSWDCLDQSAPVLGPQTAFRIFSGGFTCLVSHKVCLSPGVSRPRLLVRRLGRRVGCSSWSSRRFRPLGRGGGASLHQRQGAASRPSWSPPLSVISVRKDRRGLLQQRHCGGVSAQSRGHQVSLAEFHRSGDPAFVGVASHSSGSTIHPGLQQRPGGRSVSPSPASTFRVVPQHDSISVFESSVASPNNLFATSANHRCSTYFSPYRDLQSAGTDAFLQSWDSLQAYAFPPFAIIPRVLAKLRESRGTELTLVAPHWAQRPWFPDLLQLSLAPPVVLPDHLDLLLLPRSRLRYPGLHRLRLHAWRLSSGSPEPQVSRRV